VKIKIIMPITRDIFDADELKTAKRFASEGTEVACVHLEKGPESIEDQYDEALAVPGILDEVKKAEDEGYDGVLISCYGDPGLKPARELANIPIVGPAETSMLFASALGQRFSIVTIVREVVPLMEDNARILGVEKLASVRYVGIPVLELENEDKLQEALFRESLKAVEQDRAHVIILGCTGMIDVASTLSRRLREEKGYDIPVIDPAMISLKFLESLIKLGLKQSRLTYMMPTEKRGPIRRRNG